MGTRLETINSALRTAISRRWRSVLAAVISFALILSFFHGWSPGGDENVPAISIAQAIGDASGKAPIHPAPIHDDHCLTHVSSVAAQETAVAIDYIANSYRSASLPVPDTADLLSPFKPPRA
jgi:hypothetical protein